MRIREDGKHAHRTDTIEEAAEFWGCNKTKALMKSSEFVRRIDKRIQTVLARDDLTVEQKREIADTLSIPETYEIHFEEVMKVEK